MLYFELPIFSPAISLVGSKNIRLRHILRRDKYSTSVESSLQFGLFFQNEPNYIVLRAS